ncbi:DUF3892 domain-containing protein [Staphylococcus xylosus]|uniref:DUF3892 domain-containing protein n=1 Tax=Staphylococcus xylosus TaxID=1288 RepID=UPI002174D7E0|nr:DUF3892 domain-containing protein [Staphylococcus xylosus]
MYQITHVRLFDSNASGTERIRKIKLSDGTIETVEMVAKFISMKMEYYYTTSANSKADVEAVYPKDRKPYIRTVANGTESDNLLSLPRF